MDHPAIRRPKCSVQDLAVMPARATDAFLGFARSHEPLGTRGRLLEDVVMLHHERLYSLARTPRKAVRRQVPYW